MDTLDGFMIKTKEKQFPLKSVVASMVVSVSCAVASWFIPDVYLCATLAISASNVLYMINVNVNHNKTPERER